LTRLAEDISLAISQRSVVLYQYDLRVTMKAYQVEIFVIKDLAWKGLKQFKV
jgi:hypothetical protein